MDIKVLVPISHGTEELEAITIIDLLRRGSINVKVAGENEIITCSRGVKIIPDCLLHKLEDNDEFDAIVIPGGYEGTNNLMNNEKLQAILKHNFKSGKLIGAICAAPIILVKHKLISKDFKITSHPSVKNYFEGYDYSEDRIVIQDNIITSRAVGTAIDFALVIIELLINVETAEKIAREILY